MRILPPFAETVAALLQSTAILRCRAESTGHAVAAFNIKSLVVEVEFAQRSHDGPWHVAFANQTNIALAFRIFNGAFKAVWEFMERHQPKILVFTAEDADVANIYDTYLRRERRRMVELGYELMCPDRVAPQSYSF
jgi:hypothetical protein